MARASAALCRAPDGDGLPQQGTALALLPTAALLLAGGRQPGPQGVGPGFIYFLLMCFWSFFVPSVNMTENIKKQVFLN